MNNLQRRVERRLDPYAAIGALRWLPVRDQPSSEEIYRACEPLLSLDLWQRLVNAGYRTHLPDAQTPACIQVIVLWDTADAGRGFSLQDLSLSLQEARSRLAGKGEITVTLIVLGDASQVPAADLSLFWPRIRMGPTALGGMRVDRSRVLEACQHVLVALICSDVMKIIDEIVEGKQNEVGWLVLGASALIVDPLEAQRWLQEAVIREVLAPILSKPSDPEIQQIEKQAKEEAWKVRRSLAKEAVDSLKEVGWEIKLEEEGFPAVTKCTLVQPQLLEAAFGPYQQRILPAQGNFAHRIRDWLVTLTEPFLPAQDLSEKLQTHYLSVNQTLKQRLSLGGWKGLAAQALREYRRLEERLAGLLDPGLALSGGRHPKLTGLMGVILALCSLIKHLGEEGDLEDARTPRREKVQPAPLDSEKYLRAAAEMDAHMIWGKLLGYSHFARTLASPWGVLLNLLPAWFLGAFLLSASLNWGTGKSLLVFGLALVILGVAEVAYWWLIRARGVLERVVKEAHSDLARRTLALTARTLQDYRHWLITRLQDVEQSLWDLYTLFWKRYRETDITQEALEKACSYPRGGTYFLVDKEQLYEWTQRAVREVHRFPEWYERAGTALREWQERVEKESGERYGDRGAPEFQSAVTALIAARCWPLAEQPEPPWRVLKELETRCIEEAHKQINPRLLYASVVAEKIEDLKGGKRWRWLWHQAQPLGHGTTRLADFTIIIAPEEMLSGPTGRDGLEWRSEWRIAKSGNPFEEMCIRGFVERTEEV